VLNKLIDHTGDPKVKIITQEYIDLL